jgi:RNA-binding protein
MNLLWLFLEFFKIGICAFGGGLATIPFLEELSQTRGWFTLDQLADMLRKREIVKVTILETAGLETKETANAICEARRAEFVQAIGYNFTLYKRNTENPQIVFPGHEQAKAKVKAENVTKKGKATKRSYR